MLIWSIPPASEAMVYWNAVFRLVWTLFVVMVAQVAVLPNVLAYEESRTEYGARLRLTSLPARVRLDSPVPGFSDGGRGALLHAIATWNARACSSPVLILTEDEDDALIEIVPILDHWKFENAIAAHTSIEGDSFQGDIRHVVIEIDARRPWSQEAIVSPDALDLESVFLHELGHALALDHSRNQDAVMRGGIKPGQIRRNLHADDIAGICAIASVGPTLVKSKTLFLTMVLFLVGAAVVVWAFVKRMIGRYSSCKAR